MSLKLVLIRSQESLDLVHHDLALGGLQGPQHLADAVDPDRQHQEVDAVEEAVDIA